MPKCFICERDDVEPEQMRGGRREGNGVCIPCERDYTAFRRAFKAEHGRWPTMKEFRSDDDAEPLGELSSNKKV